MKPIILNRNRHLYRIENYLGYDGYEALRNALSLEPDTLIDMVKRSGLRGCGGAGFPTGVKWGFVPKAPGQKYLCCNGDEGEPGSFKDREIMEEHPHLLLEGIAIACRAIGATVAYIYVRGEYSRAINRIETAIKDAGDKGLLPVEVLVHKGAGAYICGEETALLESIEGKRGMPRLRPPFPAVSGLYGRPTVINNVETLSYLPYIILNGPESFSSVGTGKSRGHKIFSVSGHVNRPGNYEVIFGITLRELIYDHAGGVRGDKRLKAVIPGGASSPVLTSDYLDVSMDFESLSAAGSMLGSGGVIVMDEDACMVKAAYILSRFFFHESCSKCTPCREGTYWLKSILERIDAGRGVQGDIDSLQRVCRKMAGRCFCALGEAAINPVLSSIKHFREEYDYHIREKRCMAET